MAEKLEPGLYIGTRVSGAAFPGEEMREIGLTVVKVSGEAPWLKMEEMNLKGSVIPPNLVKDLVKIDHLSSYKPTVRNVS